MILVVGVTLPATSGAVDGPGIPVSAGLVELPVFPWFASGKGWSPAGGGPIKDEAWAGSYPIGGAAEGCREGSLITLLS